jgi:hypothetical protein
MSAKRRVAAAAYMLAGILLYAGPANTQQDSRAPHASEPVLITSPLSPSAQPSQGPLKNPKEKPLGHPHGAAHSGNIADPAVQTYTSTPAAAQSLGQWEGLGVGLSGFVPTAVPPDPNMAVGPNHIVQWVNNSLVIFDKQGNVVQGPIPDETFWGSIFGTCDQLGGMSDPIVKYDRAADRWIIGEVAIPIISQFVQCFAVSKTSDPIFTSDANGLNTSYYTWAYGFGTKVNDYDKISVWPDGYYVNWNIFDASSGNFLYPEACAWNRTDMLAGVAAPRFVCFNLSNNFASLLASDWDGSTAPPAGSPNYLMEVDTVAGTLEEWQFHVDYATPANSTLTGPEIVSGVAPFSTPCPSPGDSRNCIPQPGTAQTLDTLSDRLMYRLAYRNFGDHESIVANHTVNAGANTGVRWYEVRNPPGTPTVYQQGTFAPDSDNRWMASVAMDQSGNIGVGYSVASASTYPSIRYTGWEVGDPLGTLQAETRLIEGGGSQTGSNRWGDYSAMQIDPSDGCTFWYTQEYEAGNQSTDWNTRIGSFKFSSCGQALAATTTSLVSSLNPSNSGQSVTFTATVSSLSGTPTGTVTFNDGATPLGTAALSGGQAQLSTSTLSVGTHSITATYNGSATFSTSTSAALMQTVNATIVATTTTLTSSLDPSVSGQSVTLTATVSPSTATGTVTFYDNGTSIGSAALSSGTAKLSISTLSVGTHPITATYNGDSKDSSSTSNIVSQNVTGFTISAPSPQTVHHGSNLSFVVTVTPLNGFSGSVSLSVTGLPSRSTASFSPQSASGPSWTSTLTISTTGRTPTGTRTLTIKGTSGTLSKTTTVQLTVN